MKKHTLRILGLAAIVSIIPSFTHTIDVTRDGITVRVTYEQDKSDLLKSSNLACLYVRIKNDTDTQVELSKYGVASSLFASEKTLTDLTTGTAKEIAKFVGRYVLAGGAQAGIGVWGSQVFDTYPYSRGVFPCRPLYIISGILAITSPITGLTWAITAYNKKSQCNKLLQEYLERKATSIQIGGEVGLYVFIDLDQYNRSIGKNIIIRMHKKGSDEILVYEIDAAGLLRTA